MEYMLVASAVVALVILVAVLGILRGCDVEITFHAPIFVKIRVTAARQPQSRSRTRRRTTIPARRQATGRSPEQAAISVSPDTDSAVPTPESEKLIVPDNR